MDSKLLKEAKERFQEASEAENWNREQARQDLRFLAGDQWDERARQQRESSNRPVITINKLPGFVAQVVNDSRQNKPAIKISPTDDSSGDADTAEVIQGLIRHIEYASDADVAYQTAFEHAVMCGFGAFRILTDYAGDESFDLEIKIEPIADPFSVYFDPYAKRADGSDARYVFVVERMSKQEFKERWPGSETSSTNFFDGDIGQAEGWITDDSVQVAEYWYVRTKRKRLLALADGTRVFEDQLGPEHEGIAVLKEREVLTREIRCASINGAETLEDEPWPGQYLPIVRIFGREMVVDGERRLFSLIRFARDPQQLYNYYKTAQAETVMLAPKSPWIGAEGQFAGHEHVWRTANLINHPYLQYKPISINGQPVPPPTRNTFEPPIQALSVGAAQSSDDIKATTGIYDASLGARSNETSGKAILARQREGDVATYHFLDNLARSQRQAGRILVDLIPRIYDTARTIRIIGEDDSQRVIRVNERFFDEEANRYRHYDLSVGKYDVTVSTGPSYTTKRQEAFDMLTKFAQAYPQLLQIAGDILFRNSDVPGAPELADRFRKTLPPNLAEDDKQGGEPVPPQVQAKLQQMSQMIEQLTAELNRANDDIKAKRLELESRERIETLKAEVELLKTQAQLGSRNAIETLQAEIRTLGERLQQLNAAPQPESGGPDYGPAIPGAGVPSQPTGGLIHPDTNP